MLTIVVEGKVVVELKCKDVLRPVDKAQLLSHLRLLDVPVGFLINFHVVFLREGTKLMVNNYRSPLEKAFNREGRQEITKFAKNSLSSDPVETRPSSFS